MRLNLGLSSLAGLLLLLTIGAIPVDANIQLMFDLDSCSWAATHVVLVNTTSRDGVFSVVKSWKGDLKPGESVEVPGLNPDKDAVPISSYPKQTPGQIDFETSVSRRIPKQPVGSQVILFLKRRQEGAPASSSASIRKVQWEPASGVGMQISAIWIDGGKAYCFLVVSESGASTLSECNQ